MPFELDAYTTKMVTAIGLLILIGLLWMVWKFFYTVFKHVLVALFIAAIGSGVYYYVMNQAPPKDPNMGKHAYSARGGNYFGEIEAAQNDPQSGPVWVIRQPDGHLTKIAKARVIVKDKMDPVESPTPAETPAQTPKPKSGRRATS